MVRATVDGFDGTWQVVNRRADNGLVELLLRNDRGSWFADPCFVTFLDGSAQPTKAGLAPAWRRTLRPLTFSPLTDKEIDERAGNRNLMWTVSMRSEMRLAGLVQDSGRRTVSESGAQHIIWQITDLGRAEYSRRGI